MTGRGLELPSDALRSGTPLLADYPPVDADVWRQATDGRPVKEVVLRRIDGAPYYDLRLEPAAAVPGERLLLAADTLRPREVAADVAALRARLELVVPDVALVEAARLDAYDAYYYGRGDTRPPLPVVRVRFADPLQTWFYIDPADLRVVRSEQRYSRLERWLFNGLHSPDFAFWYDRRPLWDIGLIALSLGGLASSGIGLWVGGGRVARAIRRRPR